MSAQTTDLTAWLDELDAAHKAATPGPWEDDYVVITAGTAEITSVRQGRDGTHVVTIKGVKFHETPSADAAAIVAEHNATPKLTAALRAVLALAEELDVYTAYRIRAAVAAAHTEDGR